MVKSPNNRKVVVCGNICPNKFGCIVVKYTGGYTEYPADLFDAILSMVESSLAEECGQQVSSYKIGDKAVSFCCGSDSQFGISKIQFGKTMNRYKKPAVIPNNNKPQACCDLQS